MSFGFVLFSIFLMCMCSASPTRLLGNVSYFVFPYSSAGSWFSLSLGALNSEVSNAQEVYTCRYFHFSQRKNGATKFPSKVLQVLPFH